MPGLAHELMVQLIKEHPDVIESIVRVIDPSLEHIKLPREFDDSVARFTDPTEVRPDVILGRDPTRPWFIVDVQINRDGEKVLRWPLAWLLVRLERKRPGDLLIITHDPKVAEWIITSMVPNILAIRATFEPQAEARGEARGEERGEARGQLRGEAKAILMVLKARSVAIADEQRDRIAQCSDPALIERWLERAGTATTIDEVFRE